MTQEEKAKRYDEALKKMKSWVRGEHPECFTEAQKTAEFIFPELKESEDDRIRKAIMEFFELQDDNTTYSFIPKKDILAWLEKQGKHLENYDEAEKEKTEFVGDGFIKCHADFLDFKEGNTYWLEYIGDDKYNVRSDNLLGQTYHITPGQLYTVFKKLTWIGNWIGKRGGNLQFWKPTKEQFEALDYAYNSCPDTERGNYYEGVLETLIDDLHRLEKQGEKNSKKVSLWKHWKDGIAGNAEGKQIYLTKIGNTYNISSCLSFECDYIELSDLDNLMSKGQCEPNPYSGVSFKYNGHTFGMSARDGGAEVLMDGNLKAFISSDKSFTFPHPTLTPKSALEAAKEEEEKVDNVQNWVIPNSNPEPEFREGEWVVHNHDICQIVKREEGCNKLVTVFGIEKELVNERNLSTAHLWNIQDAKDGDVLACGEEILLFKSYSVQGRISLYCWYNGQTNNFHNKEVVDILLTTRNKVCPATKEQRDLLFSKMKEAGYEWDAEKKKLKKIDDEEVNGEDYGIDGLWHAKRILEKTLGSVSGYQTDDGILDHKAAITAVKKLYEQKPTWSKEDEKILQWIISDIKKLLSLDKKSPIISNIEIAWLKSLKERIGG